MLCKGVNLPKAPSHISSPTAGQFLPMYCSMLGHRLDVLNGIGW